MLVKVYELSGIALDWAIAKASGLIRHSEWTKRHLLDPQDYSPSTNWSQGGPIIEKEKIYLEYWDEIGEWVAGTADGNTELFNIQPLVAAMRCYVASKLGDTVDIPEELLK